jgi:hypothetical protein
MTVGHKQAGIVVTLNPYLGGTVFESQLEHWLWWSLDFHGFLQSHEENPEIVP